MHDDTLPVAGSRTGSPPLVMIIGAVLVLSACGSASFGSEDALAATDEFYAALNDGDVEDAVAMFTPDAEFTNEFLGIVDRDFTVNRFEWFAGQGSQFVEPTCSVGSETAAGVFTVNCDYGTHQGLGQAVGGPPFETSATLSVSADGIGLFIERFGEPDFLWVGEPFALWVEDTHPDEAAAMEFGAWTSAEEARAAGERAAALAAEFAAFLDSSGCTFRQYVTVRTDC